MQEFITYAAARATQAGALDDAIGILAASVRVQRDDGGLRGPGPILVGIGASLAAACAPVWALRSRGIDAWRLGAGDHPLPYPASPHPVIGVSQSGRSAETLAVLTSVGPERRYAVVNAHPSPISAAAGRRLELGNIPDSYASTIGYTATVAGLGMLADAWDGGDLDPGWARLPELFRRTEDAVGERAGTLAEQFRDAGSADFVGAGPSVGSAEAGALLLREVARLPSTAMSTRQYLHGAMESAGDGVHVLFGDDREIALAGTLADAGHRVLLVSSVDVPERPGLRAVRLPAVPPSQRAVLEAIVTQVLAAAVAEIRGVAVEEFVFHHTDTKVRT
jgi:fructoselysine-6-P-deglycase FrlB-like protein